MRRALIVLVTAFVPCVATAQQHVHERGEKLGIVHFPVSCKEAVAPEFDRAVALLHSFEFGEAIKGFNRVLARDPACGMAYWGIAMSTWSNPMAAANRPPAQLLSGRKAIEAARKVASQSSARERGYIEAVAKLYDSFESSAQRDRVLAYEHAMHDVSTGYPGDTEAQIFYAISLVGSAPPTDKTYANQNKAADILVPLWKKQPDHPGLAHYIIHTFDYPALASRGADAAREYAKIAPSAAHAQHMPSHIFTRTGMWKESIATNLQSMEIAEKSGSIAEALHAADYAEYAYLQLGLDSLARSIVDRLPRLVARFDVNAITGAAPGSAGVFAIAAIPARYALERNAWSDAAALQPARSDFPWTDAMTWFARAIGAARLKNVPAAQVAVDSLGATAARLETMNEPYWREQVAIQVLEATAWLALAKGQTDDAERLMREAARREDATEKSAVTPGPLAPAHELLGDMLMELGRKTEALAEYNKTLVTEPNRRRALAGAALAKQ
ncbi:MAG TPA: hypothetical protein VF042_05105 [Gemmatimonadaceae bacterium]